jgi:hypothetical protein
MNLGNLIFAGFACIDPGIHLEGVLFSYFIKEVNYGKFDWPIFREEAEAW